MKQENDWKPICYVSFLINEVAFLCLITKVLSPHIILMKPNKYQHRNKVEIIMMCNNNLISSKVLFLHFTQWRMRSFWMITN